MAVKNANVIARVEPEIKEKAEAVLGDLGLPVSVVINTLYRQIIMKNGLPFPLVVSRSIPTRESLSEEEFNSMMEEGLKQAKSGRSVPLGEAFEKIMDSI